LRPCFDLDSANKDRIAAKLADKCHSKICLGSEALDNNDRTAARLDAIYVIRKRRPRDNTQMHKQLPEWWTMQERLILNNERFQLSAARAESRAWMSHTLFPHYVQ
jgi:hypothetical protein